MVVDKALMRDTRMVERKKTGKAKARKKVRPIAFMVVLVLTELSTPGSRDDGLSITHAYQSRHFVRKSSSPL